MAPPLHSPSPSRRYPVAAFFTWFLTIFLVLFPKGGVRVGPIPLTWGYLLLGLSLPVLFVVRIVGYPWRIRPRTLAAFASTLPFTFLFIFSYRANGIAVMGAAVSDFVSFIVLPVAFLLVYPAFLTHVDGPRLDRLLRFSILAAALFGIFLFVLYPITHKLIEIPYLTVNAEDYGLIESTKNIARGYFLKLISTYNNGNVYGVATLLLLPLYDKLEPRLWRRNTVRLALVFTLSRSIWAGLVIEQLLSLLRLGADAAATFPRLYPGPALRRAAVLLGVVGAIFFGVTVSSLNLSFLFAQDLGGRADTLAYSVHHVTLLPSVPIGPFAEIIYTTALADYGVLGLLALIFLLAFPILLFLAEPSLRHSPLRLAALKGLILYSIVAGADGAINLIPVMAFYWFVYMVFLEGWPGGLRLSSAPSAHLSQAAVSLKGTASAVP